MATSTESGGLEALHRLKSIDPPVYLSPSEDLSQAARAASQYLFSHLKPFTPKSPFDRLLTDGFDSEQIWQQLDLQSQPLISSLRRDVKRFEKNPEEISKLFGKVGVEKSEKVQRENGELKTDSENVEELDEMEDEEMDAIDDEDEDEDGDGDEDDDDNDEEEEDDEEGEEEEEGGVEDKFLKIKELEEYLEDDEAKEYGFKKKKVADKVSKKVEDDDDDEDEDENDDEDEDDEEVDGEDDDEDEDELDVFGADVDDEDGEDALGNARYDDFFGATKKIDQKKQSQQIDESDDSEFEGFDDAQEDDKVLIKERKENLSTHEKQLEKLRDKIEIMEKSNMEPKTWTMQGEVTAAKRPKNSALEVDLDFEHNVRPAPIITEEVTASLEELIQKRILEERFDDVQKVASLSSKAPRERKELDENKSKKGLAELYEDEYAQKTGLVSAALSFSDEQKKEAKSLFKELCLKLDALSHFHFTPKPIIEDMSIEKSVPALAMEEIAPVAVSEAAMLAPEEVYAGKGDFKEEAELTQAERKRRRANKKRKFKAKAVNTMANKAQKITAGGGVDGDKSKEDS